MNIWLLMLVVVTMLDMLGVLSGRLIFAFADSCTCTSCSLPVIGGVEVVWSWWSVG